ncbi:MULTISPECIES: amino acid ABC transporter ATP-binding protein [unclassified Bosea (in: a-proteobacteria)]|uniref:amino acid ABC transporter ATP-binding protein n=1 Tax=unclassified Bosea (in: a-proteobacteria) TaxID=2653178 RepID=UPI00083D83A7|nr:MULTISPECIES: amino acid ABC transporter ATP-binding protein [unclassified Bosea (in: a-proteobacteria)]AOG07574.1 ABC transporter family protein [Bosea sp. RAC05]MDP3257531.1 amino acid ABC transporter ATP-binding protein [Bosea sp. (in: a-proteobacteria)]MDP3321315.1 amino acid ABC transporter ATP-binding protein [Bosea sp. (in: a-proteobacteria)]
MPHLVIDRLSANYGTAPVLQDVSLSVERGEIVSIIGPSGSGKSTLLRVLTGLLKPHAGVVHVAGAQVDYGSAAALKKVRDRFAVVFQQYNLFQNMTALRNVTIAPTIVKKRDAAEVEREARALLEKVGLSHRIEAYPDELSGGQQQRVAIARALALKPEILLLDEVTSALDPELVAEVLDTIRVLAAEGMTMLIVSHEMGFVREISSKVVFMADGKVVEVGPPEQIFDAPQTERCADFVRRILRH